MTKVLIIGGTGFIGSRLYRELSLLDFDVSTCDLEWFGNYVNHLNIAADYATLTEDMLKSFDVIIHLAGHSSVSMCKIDPEGCIRNNLTNFKDLLQKVPTGCKLIYASSSAIYDSAVEPATESWTKFKEGDMMTSTKLKADKLCFEAEYRSDVFKYGLRFGSVNGWSINYRKDLMINKMICDALENKTITISNGEYYRPLLGLSDLSSAVIKLIQSPPQPGLYNLHSLNAKIADIGVEVAKQLEVPVRYEEGSPTFDFKMSSDRIKDTFKWESKATIKSIVKEILEGFQNHANGVEEVYPSLRELPGEF